MEKKLTQAQLAIVRIRRDNAECVTPRAKVRELVAGAAFNARKEYSAAHALAIKATEGPAMNKYRAAVKKWEADTTNENRAAAEAARREYEITYNAQYTTYNTGRAARVLYKQLCNAAGHML